MLAEFSKVAQQRDADGTRRWFFDDEMDLIVWLADDGSVTGFELCYDKSGHERAFVWRRGDRLRHYAVDGGESTPLRNDSPILVSGGKVEDRERVREDFRARAEKLELGIVEGVCAALRGD